MDRLMTPLSSKGKLLQYLKAGQLTIASSDEIEDAVQVYDRPAGGSASVSDFENEENPSEFANTIQFSEGARHAEDDATPIELSRRAHDRQAIDSAGPGQALSKKDSGRSTKARALKKKNVSRFGIEYPDLSTSVVKKLALKYAGSSRKKAKIDKDMLDALQTASDVFFEQVSTDLAAYSEHAGRKTIDDADMIALLKR